MTKVYFEDQRGGQGTNQNENKDKKRGQQQGGQPDNTDMSSY